jgi:hypothetical protein
MDSRIKLLRVPPPRDETLRLITERIKEIGKPRIKKSA